MDSLNESGSKKSCNDNGKISWHESLQSLSKSERKYHEVKSEREIVAS